MNILIACEFSGAVRDAFRRLGHEAWSCDFEDPEGEWPNYHFQGDIRWWLYDQPPMPWDLLIAHPPCTYMCNSGVKWLYRDGRAANGRDPARWDALAGARTFFYELWNAPVPRIAIENPIPHGHAQLPPPTQIVQPWQFGHGETKATCLWLKGLKPLQPSNIVEGRSPVVHYMSPGPNRGKDRARTYPGIAEAMASQWFGHS